MFSISSDFFERNYKLSEEGIEQLWFEIKKTDINQFSSVFYFRKMDE